MQREFTFLLLVFFLILLKLETHISFFVRQKLSSASKYNGRCRSHRTLSHLELIGMGRSRRLFGD